MFGLARTLALPRAGWRRQETRERQGIMNRKLLLIVFSLWLAGCASISTRTRIYPGAPKYPPTDPLKVEILRVAPTRPHDRLGEIALDATDDPSRERIEKKLKNAAAKLGADAMVVVFDQR